MALDGRFVNQNNQVIKGDLQQSGQLIHGNLWQDDQIVNGNIYMHGQEVRGEIHIIGMKNGSEFTQDMLNKFSHWFHSLRGPESLGTSGTFDEFVKWLYDKAKKEGQREQRNRRGLLNRLYGKC